jgi:hypothetical protein
MENSVFTKQWWGDIFQLNEVADEDMVDRVIKGFKLVRYSKGFGQAYKTEKGQASPELSTRINKWIKDKFPESKIYVRYEKTYGTINIFGPKTLHESPPIDFEQDDYQDYTLQNRHKIEKAARVFNLPISDMEYAFNAGREVVLSDEMWSNLQNSKSYKMKSLDEAIQHALKLGIEPKPYIEAIKKGDELPLPLVLCYAPNKYYLVGGEIILSLYKALGSIPTVLQGTLNLKIKDEDNSNKLNENKQLIPKQIKTIKTFLAFTANELGLKKVPSGLTLSHDNSKAKGDHTFGYFNPETDKMWLYVGNRNMADILRTLGHELVHLKQHEEGRIKADSGKTGSDIENEANAKAGVLLRNFGKEHSEIYEAKIFGKYLFGDKETGAHPEIGIYDKEVEPDTPAEKALFKILKKYTDSQRDIYSSISLDQYKDTFQKLKKEYPDIADSRLSNDIYIYRGTTLPLDKVKELLSKHKSEEEKHHTTIYGVNYNSRRLISSWSTSYEVGVGFALSSRDNNPKEIPVVMRTQVENANLVFSQKFIEKISTYYEDEVINLKNNMVVDVLIIKDDEYDDKF